MGTNPIQALFPACKRIVWIGFAPDRAPTRGASHQHRHNRRGGCRRRDARISSRKERRSGSLTVAHEVVTLTLQRRHTVVSRHQTLDLELRRRWMKTRILHSAMSLAALALVIQGCGESNPTPSVDGSAGAGGEGGSAGGSVKEDPDTARHFRKIRFPASISPSRPKIGKPWSTTCRVCLATSEPE